MFLLDVAARAGRFRYVELDLFAKLGARSTTCRNVTYGAIFASLSGAHSYRAALFEQLLPVSIGLPSVGELTVGPGEELDALYEGLSALDDEELASVLAGAVYPAMLVAYEQVASGCSPFSDGAFLRAIGRGTDDLSRCVVEIDAVTTHRSAVVDRITTRLTVAGGPFGPLPVVASVASDLAP